MKQTSAINRQGWLVIFITYASLFAVSLFDNIKGALYPEFLEHFSIATTKGSYFFFFSSLGVWLGTGSAKWWLPRFSSISKLLIYSHLLLVSVALGTYFFAQLGSGLWGVLLFAFVFGFVVAGFSIANHDLLASAVSGDLALRAFSGLHVMYGGASLIAPLLAVQMRSIGLAWNEQFLALTIFPVVVGILAVFALRGREVHAHAVSAESATGITGKTPWVLAIAFAFYVAAEVMVGSRIVEYATQMHSWPLDNANYLMSAYFLCLMLGRLFFTVKKVAWTPLQMMLGSVVCGGVLLALGLWLSPLLVCVSGLGMAPFFPSMMTYIAQHYPRSVGQTTASVSAVGAIGLMLMHQLVGAVGGYANMQIALSMGPLCLLIAMTLLLFERQQVSRQGEVLRN